MKRLLADTSGSAQGLVLSFAPLWFIVFGVFLMNVQLGRNYIQRDVVDHAVALAADTAAKVACADDADLAGSPVGSLDDRRLAVVRASVAPLLALVASTPDACRLSVAEAPGGTGGPGTMTLRVSLDCELPCDIPVAAQAMCSGTPRRVRFAARQTTVAMGCDVRSQGG